MRTHPQNILFLSADEAAVLLFILLVSGNTSPLPAATPAASPTPGQVSVQADAATVAPLLEQSAQLLVRLALAIHNGGDIA